jgi:hypothetical protein
VHLLGSPFHETVSQPGDHILDSGSNDFFFPITRTMSLKVMFVPLIGDNSFAGMDGTAHLIRNFLAYLGQLLLSSAIVFGERRELFFAKEKDFAVAMSAPSWACPIGRWDSNESVPDLCSRAGGPGIKQSEEGRDSAGVTG